MKVGIVEQSLSTSGKKWLCFPRAVKIIVEKNLCADFLFPFFAETSLIGCRFRPITKKMCWLNYSYCPHIAVDSDDAMGVNTSILSSPTPPSAGPYGKEIGGTPPQSPSVSTALSGAGYGKMQSEWSRTKKILALLSHLHFSNLATPHPTFCFVSCSAALHVRAAKWWDCRWTTGRGKARRKRKTARRETLGWRTPWRVTSAHCKSAACPVEGSSPPHPAWPWL